MATGRERFSKLKPIINTCIYIVGLIPNNIINTIFQKCRNLSGKKGILIRYILLKNIAKSCGDNVSIHQNVYIFNPQNLTIGNNVSIHPMCYIECLGGVNIGNEVSIAHASSILSVNHTWEDSIPIKYNKISQNKVDIKDDVWIGCGVRILSGATINSRSVVAAGAVVTKEVECNSVQGGIPAKKIKSI